MIRLVTHALTFALGIGLGIAALIPLRPEPPTMQMSGAALGFDFVLTRQAPEEFDPILSQYLPANGGYLRSAAKVQVVGGGGMILFEDQDHVMTQRFRDYATVQFSARSLVDRGIYRMTIGDANSTSTHWGRLNDGEARIIPVDLGRQSGHGNCFLIARPDCLWRPILKKK